jgi:hypothetical protein
MNDTTTLFMFPFQHSLRGGLKIHAESVLAQLGIEVEVKTLLVGVRRPGTSGPHPVCIEPENAEWTLDIFDGVPQAVQDAFETHEGHKMFYSNDEIATREKPENIRRDCVRRTVQAALSKVDAGAGVVSFFGPARPILDYHVVPVIQVPSHVFELYPPLPVLKGWAEYQTSEGLLSECMGYILADATEEMGRPNPGRDFSTNSRSAAEIVRHAAETFMRAISLSLRDKEFPFVDLFTQINELSSLLYEGSKGMGRLLLIAPDNPAIVYSLRLASPVPFRQARWARKILQMSSPEFALVANGHAIQGLGDLCAHHDSSALDAFWIDFIDHYHWNLRLGRRTLMCTAFGEARLPQEPIAQPRFYDSFLRQFPGTSEGDAERMWQLLKVMAEGQHGSMIMIATDAATEAARLSRQGMVIKPTLMTAELLRRASRIDGTILLDPFGVCHALGVILDGLANERCTPSRGSRYNSAVRYVYSSASSRMALVQSDDGTTDILPLLRPRISRDLVEAKVRELEGATPDNFHDARRFIDEKRFYLSEEQCHRVNSALDRIDAMPRRDYSIHLSTNRCTPTPEMNDGYYA